MVVSQAMIPRILLCFLFVLIHVLSIAARTNPDDSAALQSLKDSWQNVPPNWVGADPCGSSWDGIGCRNSRVVSITLSSMSLEGQLSGDIQGLAELETLDLSYNKELKGSLPQSIGKLTKLSNLILVGCGFSGPIPDTIGSLTRLVFLSLNSNNFIGGIPATVGYLTELYWLDLADNKLTGTIPVSNGSSPGLDLLVHTKHFHFGKNQLSGEIPAGLFHSNLSLIHLLVENNKFTGNIPDTLGLVQTMEVLRLDRNSLSGSVPQNLNNLTHVNELHMSNNNFNGLLPNLTGMNVLNYLDMSNNSFNASDFPSWIPNLISLTSLVMENTGLQGTVPASLFSLYQLQTVILRNNKLNGSLTIDTTYSNQLQLIDVQRNLIESFTQRPGYPFQIMLAGNPFCNEGGDGTQDYCVKTQQTETYSTPPENCLPTDCSSNRVSSPTCKCAFPYTGNIVFRAPSFSNLGNRTTYETLQKSLMQTFQNRQLPVESVSLSNPTKNLDDYLVIHLQVFPSTQDFFNRTGVSGIGFVLSNQTFKPPSSFGPFFFIGEGYKYFDGASSESKNSSSTGIIIGAAVGGSVIAIIALIIGVYAFRQKKRAEDAAKRSDPFASWDSNKHSGAVPQLTGARFFSFEELKKWTNNFSETNDIGCGGYGKVYRGTLPNGELVAIKRALQGSMQGAHEFKTEIELLSRVHHKNVVGLAGFCFDQAEQMLVYEYIPNGTLKDGLSGKTGIRLDWMRRLRIAVGAARGLQYLHDLVNPPIIHRDIKSNNILLDDRLNARVADFGLSKLLGDSDRGHITTQVKGTMGYMDPEYYMTNQLTEKSDVYSFGVVLLEIVTGKVPIEKGRYIVREVKTAMDRSKDMYNLQDILDPAVRAGATPRSLEKFVDLALKCVEEEGANRPSMSEVVKEIENIMEMAGLNPNADSASSSATYEGPNKGMNHPYTDESLFVYSGAYPNSKLMLLKSLTNCWYGRSDWNGAEPCGSSWMQNFTSEFNMYPFVNCLKLQKSCHLSQFQKIKSPPGLTTLNMSY
uniref:non-specific serine/threonine protein kinase n=1 Tax=Solanum lycopersicum TaxID=4081 RepID=A0A3Q7EQZ7_SOLLC